MNSQQFAKVYVRLLKDAIKESAPLEKVKAQARSGDAQARQELQARALARKKELELQLKHLDGKKIDLIVASEKYDLDPQQLRDAIKLGRIRCVMPGARGRGRAAIVLEKDVAVLSDICRFVYGQGSQVLRKVYPS